MRMILPNAVLLKLCSIRAPKRPYGQNADSWDLPVKSGLRLFLLISITEGDCHAYAKTGLDLQLIATQPGFQFETSFFSSFKKIFSIFHFSKLVPQHGLDAFFAKVFLIDFSFNDVSARLEPESFRSLAVDFV